MGLGQITVEFEGFGDAGLCPICHRTIAPPNTAHKVISVTEAGIGLRKIGVEGYGLLERSDSFLGGFIVAVYCQALTV
jgi:hypothetical protein